MNLRKSAGIKICFRSFSKGRVEPYLKYGYETLECIGWFWEPESIFGAVPGVVFTRAGYAGGEKVNPSYYRYARESRSWRVWLISKCSFLFSLGNHTETVEIWFNPSQGTSQYYSHFQYFFGLFLHNIFQILGCIYSVLFKTNWLLT